MADDYDPLSYDDSWAAAAAAQHAAPSGSYAQRPSAAPYYQPYDPAAPADQGGWGQYGEAQYAGGEEFTGATTGEYEFMPPRQAAKAMDFDTPPSWDGSKPEVNVRPYLKLLRYWLHITKTRELGVSYRELGRSVIEN